MNVSFHILVADTWLVAWVEVRTRVGLNRSLKTHLSNQINVIYLLWC